MFMVTLCLGCVAIIIISEVWFDLACVQRRHVGGAARAVALPTFEGKACNERSEFIWPSRHAQTSLAS